MRWFVGADILVRFQECHLRQIFGIMLVANNHLNKSGGKALYRVLDSIAFLAMVYGPLLVFGVMTAFASTPTNAQGAGALLTVGLAAALVGFAVWCTITVRFLLRNSQSIGKKILGIKVVRSNGTPVSFSRLFWLRNFLIWIVSLIPLFGIVDSLFIFGESRQCLHDKIADTIVVVA